MNNDFVVTVHALERFEERFPTLYTSDGDVGTFIHGECMDAMTEGRTSTVAPLELTHHDFSRWTPGKCLYAWTPNKSRGYVLTEGPDGLTVVTVLKGKTSKEARHMLYRDKRIRKGEDGADDAVHGETSLEKAS